MTYRFVFPEALTDYTGGCGHHGGGKRRHDRLPRAEGGHVPLYDLCRPTSLHHRQLGTVTQENIPASGTAYMRRQTIELDGQDVTLQTYALPGSKRRRDELCPPARCCVAA